MNMKIPMLAIAATTLTGCAGAYWGNLIVLAITFGIFFGTLSLGRASEATRSDGGPTTSTTTRS